MRNALETTHLSKRYGRTWALQDCTLALRAGRVAALVGPNGAGKTTLLNLSVGILEPTKGSVQVLGSSPLKQPTKTLPRLGFVAQDHSLYQDFTVADLLTLGRKLNPGFDDQLARARMQKLGIPLDRRAGKLYGGHPCWCGPMAPSLTRPGRSRACRWKTLCWPISVGKRESSWQHRRRHTKAWRWSNDLAYLASKSHRGLRHPGRAGLEQHLSADHRSADDAGLPAKWVERLSGSPPRPQRAGQHLRSACNRVCEPVWLAHPFRCRFDASV